MSTSSHLSGEMECPIPQWRRAGGRANLLRILRVGDRVSSSLGQSGRPPAATEPACKCMHFRIWHLPCRSPVIIEERPRRALAGKGILGRSNSAGYGRSECEWKKRSATSLEPRCHNAKSKVERGLSRGTPRRQSAVCGLASLASIRRERWRVTVARESESASGGPALESGDLPRPQMFCTECSGELLVDMIDEGQWSVSYTQVSFARE